MNVLYFMIPVTLLLSLVFLGFFFWSVSKGHFEDLEGPAYDALREDEPETKRSTHVRKR